MKSYFFEEKKTNNMLFLSIVKYVISKVQSDYHSHRKLVNVLQGNHTTSNMMRKGNPCISVHEVSEVVCVKNN